MQLRLPPLDFTDASLLIALATIILLVTAETLPVFHGRTDSTIDKKKLENAAIVTGAMFLATVVIRIIGIISGSMT
jgi:hypothetical protein